MKTLESKSLRSKFVGTKHPEHPECEHTNKSAPDFITSASTARPSSYLSMLLILVISFLMSSGSFPVFCIEFVTLAAIAIAVHAAAERFIAAEHSRSLNETFPWLPITLGVVFPLFSFLLFAVFALPELVKIDWSAALETAVCLALMPVCNYITHKKLASNTESGARAAGLYSGIALGISTIGTLIAYGFLFNSLSWSASRIVPYTIASLPSLIAGILISLELWQKTNPSNKRLVSRFSILGMALSFLIILAPNVKASILESAQYKAQHGTAEEQSEAISFLRTFATESDLNPCSVASDNLRFGSLLLPHSFSYPNKDLYFRITGKPFNEAWYRIDWTNPTKSKATQDSTVVGSKVDGLSLAKSRITGSIDSRSLSASLDWTLIFKNSSNSEQEAKARISIPHGAVISRLTLWIDGQPYEAAFSTTAKAKAAYDWIVKSHRDPVLVTMCGPDTALLQCSPVPARNGDMKVRIGFKSPIEDKGNKGYEFSLPGILNCNFDRPERHYIHLHSNSVLAAHDGHSSTKRTSEGYPFDFPLIDNANSRSIASFRVERPETDTLIATPDWYSHGKQYIVERLVSRPMFAPEKLYVVIDQSSTLKEHLSEIKEGLAKLPASVDSSWLFAVDRKKGDKDSSISPLTMFEAMNQFQSAAFSGGQDNGPALREGLERASESADSAVLWIHGPQPLTSASYLSYLDLVHKPVLYDFNLGGSSDRLTQSLLTDNFEKLASYKVASQGATIAEDFERLYSEWQPGKKKLVAIRTIDSRPPKSLIEFDRSVSAQLTCLWAKEEVDRLLAHGKLEQAEKLASTYRLVTPVTGSVVLERESDYSTKQLRHGDYVDAPEVKRMRPFFGQESAPVLQGATNGTIGPQMDDATIIRGVNTAGTVRVNSLANSSQLFNFLGCRDANLFDGVPTPAVNAFNTFLLVVATISTCCGASMLLFGVKECASRVRSGKRRCTMGVALIAVALVVPLIGHFLN